MIKPFNINDVIQLNFKKDLKKNEKEFYKIYDELWEAVKTLPKKYNHKTIFAYFDLYYAYLSYSLAKIYYEEKDTMFLFGIDIQIPFEDILINNFKFNNYLLNYYEELYKTFNGFNLNLFQSHVIKELYKQLNKFDEYPQIAKAFKNYDNENINDIMAVKLEPDFLYENVCPKLGKKFKNLCGQGVPWFLHIKKKKFVDKLIQKINTKYYSLFNLLYLTDKHKSVCHIKNLINHSNLTQIIDDTTIFIDEENIIEYDKEYQNLLISNKFTVIYNKKFKDFIYNCKNKFIVINIGLLLTNINHANILIYNPNTNEVEIFDPSFNPKNKLYKNLNIIYKKLVKLLFPKNTKYISQYDYLTKDIQTHQESEKKAIIKQGYCASWTLWYADKRLKYPKLDAKEAYIKIIKEDLNKYKTNQIVKYTDYIRAQRLAVIEKSDIGENIKKLLIEEWNLKL